jgi:hypothetical protein
LIKTRKISDLLSYANKSCKKKQKDTPKHKSINLGKEQTLTIMKNGNKEVSLPTYLRSPARKAAFIVIISCFMGLVTALNPSPNLSPLVTFAIIAPVSGYSLFLIFFGFIVQVESIIPESVKKIIRMRNVFYVVVASLAWFFAGAFLAVAIKSSFFTLFWVYSVFALITILPCVYSLLVYAPAFQYLRSPSNERIERKKIANALILLTIGLVLLGFWQQFS